MRSSRRQKRFHFLAPSAFRRFSIAGTLGMLFFATTFASPSILIPGDGASALEIQYRDMSLPHWWCAKSSKNIGDEWERLWIPNLSELLPKSIDCWSTKMKLHYNETHVTNAPGVLGIRAIPGTKGLETFVDKPSKYQALVKGIPDMKVATYDFRLSPRGNPEFMQQLKEMVEQSSGISTVKVHLISHSLGGLLVHHFLTSHVTDSWKRQFIESWIPMAPAYGGTKYTLKQLISGDAVNIPWLNGKDVKEQQRSYETSVWLLPNPRFYSGVIVSTPRKNYTIQDYYELFRDAGLNTFPVQWERVRNLTLWNRENQLADPKVKVYPIYGTNLDTVEQYIYSSEKWIRNQLKSLVEMEMEPSI
jgi:Lecithin:cholesterol acyltransferase